MQIPLLFDFDLPGCHTAHELLGILLVLARDGIGVGWRGRGYEGQHIGTASDLGQDGRHDISVRHSDVSVRLFSSSNNGTIYAELSTPMVNVVMRRN
jgi:hypothetical protein